MSCMITFQPLVKAQVIMFCFQRFSLIKYPISRHCRIQKTLSANEGWIFLICDEFMKLITVEIADEGNVRPFLLERKMGLIGVSREVRHFSERNLSVASTVWKMYLFDFVWWLEVQKCSSAGTLKVSWDGEIVLRSMMWSSAWLVIPLAPLSMPENTTSLPLNTNFGNYMAALHNVDNWVEIKAGYFLQPSKENVPCLPARQERCSVGPVFKW